MVMHTNKGWMDEHLHPQQYSKMSVQYNLDEVWEWTSLKLALGLQRCTGYRALQEDPVERKWLFWLVNDNDWPRWWDLNIEV